MMKRLFREPSDLTREKMSMAHQGVTKSDKTKQKISDSMKKYWQQIPSNKEDETDQI